MLKSNEQYYRVSPERIAEIRQLQRSPDVVDVLEAFKRLSSCGIKSWLHGGWAVEALVKKPLEHRDIDLFVAAKARSLLSKELGDEIVYARNDMVVWAFNGVEVDISFFSPYKGHTVILQRPRILWIMPDPAHFCEQVKLAGESVPGMPAAFVLAEQEHDVRKKKAFVPKMQERAALLREVLPADIVRESRKWWPVENTPWNRLRALLRIL
jgi:hypothetical protein